MNEKPLVFAFALDENGQFKNSHFGDAIRFGIYHMEDGGLILKDKISNPLKDADENEHGSRKKGNSIISFLKDLGVNILVSLQFGPNIKMVNNHFIPVIVADNDTESVIPELKRQAQWFCDEIENQPDSYKVFRIRENGIQKKAVQ